MSASRVVVFFALTLAAPAWTLIAPTRQFFSTARQTSRMSTALAPRIKMNGFSSPIPKALNPFDWSVDRPSRPMKVEGAELYRMIGVAPEADYQEIKNKAAALAIKYDGNPKKKIKIEVACDKIVELRLRQAAKGSLMMAGESLVRNQRDIEREKEANKVDVVPKFMRGIIVYPVPKERFIFAGKYLLLPGLAVASIFPTFAPQMRAYIMIASLQLVYTRGRPKPNQEDGMPMQRHDFPTGAEVKKLFLLTGTFMLMAFGAAIVAVQTPFFTWSPRFHLVTMTLFGYAQTCLCKIYPKKGDGKKK